MRVVARLRARGHTLEQIKHASDNGQLAVGPIENLLSGSEGRVHAARRPRARAGLEPELIERIYAAMGLSALSLERDLRRRPARC